MRTYQVFNEKNIVEKVTEADLDEAAKSAGPLSTHLANAAAAARRRDLLPQLRKTLAAPTRRAKLAAARALLSLQDRDAAALLFQSARDDTDAINAAVMTATALRLHGVQPLRSAFYGEDTPRLLRELITSIYPGHLDLTKEDLVFLVEALTSFLDKKLAWIAELGLRAWQDRVYGLVVAITLDQTGEDPNTLRPPLPELRSSIVKVLKRIATSKAPRDTKQDAGRWLKAFASTRKTR
jgi:hypothetical protein